LPGVVEWQQLLNCQTKFSRISTFVFFFAAAIESAWIIKGHATADSVNLSPQQIVDCDTIMNVKGCNGGYTESAYEYITQAGGQESAAQYPYKARNGKCQFNAQDVVAKIHNYTAIPKDETSLSGTVSSTGPLSICLDASNWMDYQNGVMSKGECCDICLLDHCVQLVGYNATAPKPYWIVRNSWGPKWGIDGYIWLEMGKNTCGMTKDITWPTVN